MTFRDPAESRRQERLTLLAEARRQVLVNIALGLLGAIAFTIFMLFLRPEPAHAQGWRWFLRHIHPTGQCNSGREIIGSIYWHGRRNADGSRFNPHGISAAHRTLPFGTVVTVTRLKNGRSIRVPIKDRGPWIAGVRADGAIDLSLGAARALGMRASEFVCVEW